MDIGSVLIGLALAIVVGAYIGLPILVKGGKAVTVEDRQLSELQATRDRILNRLQELDMDYSMGKILEKDYRDERQGLMGKGAAVLKAIDSLIGQAPDSSRETAADEEIEAAVTRLRGKTSRPDLGYCPSCGIEIQRDDAFCTRCGTSLQIA